MYLVRVERVVRSGLYDRNRRIHDKIHHEALGDIHHEARSDIGDLHDEVLDLDDQLFDELALKNSIANHFWRAGRRFPGGIAIGIGN